MPSSGDPVFTDLELQVVEGCRKVSNYKKQVTPETSVNLDLGIAGDDGDELAGEIISSTGLAIDPNLDFTDYFDGEGSIVFALLLIFRWKSRPKLQPLSVRQLANALRDNPVLAKQQLDSLNAFWRRNWTLPDQGSSSTSQYR